MNEINLCNFLCLFKFLNLEVNTKKKIELILHRVRK